MVDIMNAAFIAKFREEIEGSYANEKAFDCIN